MLKKKKKRIRLIIFLTLIVLVGSAFAIGWSMLMKEHREANSVSVKDIDIATIQDGVYEGYYAGGMYGLRENKVKVTVSGGKISDIQLMDDPENPQIEVIEQLYLRVIDEQRLSVDVVTGASLTSKAYLKAIEDALIND